MEATNVNVAGELGRGRECKCVIGLLNIVQRSNIVDVVEDDPRNV